MGFFSSTEEEKRLAEEKRLKREKERVQKEEEKILKYKVFMGKVGHIHQGLSYAGLWGVRNNGSIKFKSSDFRIYDDKFIIERNKMVVEYTNIKEIFQKESFESIIILYNGDGIPIRGEYYRLKAFVNILNRFIEDNKTNNPQISNGNNNAEISGNSEDKFDKLIKLGEMYDKGLLSDEEFASLKEELLSGNNKNASDKPEENSNELAENTCENCGAEVSQEDGFCSECGTQIK